MAGERMKQVGHTELSGVSARPDVRGRGLAGCSQVFMAHRIVEKGGVPYLHAYATNSAAIGLYESIGFELRSMMNVAPSAWRMRRPPEGRFESAPVAI